METPYYGWHDPEGKYKGWTNEHRQEDWEKRLAIIRSGETEEEMKRKKVYETLDKLYNHVNNLDLPFKYKSYLLELILETKQEHNKENK